MKKTIVLVLAAALVAQTVTGCSGGGSTGKAGGAGTSAAETTTAAAAASTAAGETTKAEDMASKYEVTEPITIEWWHTLEEQYSDTVNEIVDGFNKSQDMITVVPQYAGNATKINEDLVAANAAGTGLPAITVANTSYVTDYGAGGLMEDLTPYIEATGYDTTDFGDGMIEASKYDGKLVSLPFLISTQIMFYNKDMAKEMNITIPEKWEDMDAFLEKATKKNADGTTDVYGTVIAGWDQWYFETFYLNQGVKIINDDQLTTDLGDEKAVAIAEKIKEWTDNQYIGWAAGTDAASNMRQQFIGGKTFSIVHTSSVYNTYVNQCDFEVGMAWLPGGETKNQEIGGVVVMIPSKNDQATKNAAWQFMQYLCSKDVNMQWATGTGYMPTRKSVLNTDEGKAFLEMKPAFQAIFDNLDLIKPRIVHKNWNQLATIWKNSMAEVIGEGKDVKKAMEQMAEEINEVLGDS